MEGLDQFFKFIGALLFLFTSVIVGCGFWKDHELSVVEERLEKLEIKYSEASQELQEIKRAYLEVLMEDYDKEYNNGKTK